MAKNAIGYVVAAMRKNVATTGELRFMPWKLTAINDVEGRASL